MSKKDIRPQGAEGISHPRTLSKPDSEVNLSRASSDHAAIVRANGALSDIMEVSLRCRAMLDVITGSGFAYFSELSGNLQEALLHQAFILIAEINDISETALSAPTRAERACQ